MYSPLLPVHISAGLVGMLSGASPLVRAAAYAIGAADPLAHAVDEVLKRCIWRRGGDT